MVDTSYAGGATSKRFYFRAETISTSLPYTAGLFNTATIVAQYVRNGAAAVAITLVTQTPSGAWSSGGFVHVGAGVYRLDGPDAALLAGVDNVTFKISGIADVAWSHCTVEITGSDPRAAYSADVNVTSMAANTVTASALATDAVTEIVAAIFARVYNAKMGSLTFEEITALMACVSLAKASGLPTSPVFRNLADNANAIAATTDGIGNRSSVTLTAGSVR